jgi:hypothetical protein
MSTDAKQYREAVREISEQWARDLKSKLPTCKTFGAERWDWNYYPEEPADGQAVLCACLNGDATDAQVHEGYLENGIWFYQHHTDGDASEIENVYAWREMPSAPPRKNPPDKYDQ